MKNYIFKNAGLLFLAVLSQLCALPCSAESGNKVFFTIEIDGNRVGYQKLEWVIKNGLPHFSEEMVLEVVHGNSRSVVKHEFSSWQEPGSTDLYFIKTLDAGTVKEHQEGRIHNNRVQIKSLKDIYVNTSTTLSADLVYPASQLQWYLGKNPVTGPITGFDYFDPQLLSSVAITLSSCGNETLSGGKQCRLKSYKSGLGLNKEYWFFDAEGKLVKINANLADVAMVKKPCVENCTDSVKEPWDFIGRLIVQSPYKISGKLAHGKINYLISSKSGRPLVFLGSAEQSVRAVGNKSVVSVCASCKIPAQPNMPAVGNYLKPNAWVQSDSHEIRRLALSVVPRKAPIRTKMLALVKLTQSRMKGASSYVGYSTALDALHSGSGDCGEFALLLAAFARAQGIPTRVVFGMAYSSRFTGRADVFSPHAWVQAWDKDHWVSYDAALNEFDATHIALAESDGNPEEVLAGFSQLSDIKIEKAAAITNE
jgi:hypothetical protein